MYNRILNLSSLEEDSIFIFGARQTGKSTFLKRKFPDAFYIDLLKSEEFERYKRSPSILRSDVALLDRSRLIVIDEVQKVPALLDEVQWLMVNEERRFVLCGSSARKLRRSGVNLLGGRAISYTMFPLVSAEVPDFEIVKACNGGMLPRHYLIDNPTRRIQAFVGDYLKEEIIAEAVIRNLPAFNRFLEIAAQCGGELLNYNNIASDCGVSAPTIKEYFTILEQTLVGYMIPPFTKTTKRESVKSPRFYLFDVGVSNYIQNKTNLKPGSLDFGKAFEHLVVQEIIAYLSYAERREKLSYWRTTRGYEVDLILGEGKVAIELKSCIEFQSRHTKGLKAFHEEFPSARLIAVTLDPIKRLVNGVEVYPVVEFLEKLWRGEI